MTTLFARKPSPSATNCEASGGQMKLLFLFWVTFKHWDIKKNFQKLSFQEPNRIQRDRDKSLLRLFFFWSDPIKSQRKRTENRRESPVQLFNHQNRRRRVVWLRCCRKMMLIFYSDKDQRSAGLIFFRKRSTSVEDWKDLAFSQNKITRMHCWPPPPG